VQRHVTGRNLGHRTGLGAHAVSRRYLALAASREALHKWAAAHHVSALAVRCETFRDAYEKDGFRRPFALQAEHRYQKYSGGARRHAEKEVSHLGILEVFRSRGWGRLAPPPCFA